MALLTTSTLLPRPWPDHARSAVLQVIFPATAAVTELRGRWPESRHGRPVRRVEREALLSECPLLQEELRINDEGMSWLNAARRPHYWPRDRVAIPELRTRWGWSMGVTVRLTRSTSTESQPVSGGDTSRDRGGQARAAALHPGPKSGAGAAVG